jgi:hypothetical protein
MLGLVLGFLTSIAPLITSAGLSLINLFVSNQADKEKAMKDFLTAIQNHSNDAMASVNSRFSDKAQDDALNKTLANLDKAAQAPKEPPKP